MSTTVDKTIEVSVPVRVAFDQWTQFEQFPEFMGSVQEVRQLDDSTIHWVAEMGGVRREWDATVLEQIPDRKIAWTAITGATNAGAVYFEPSGPDRTSVRLVMEYEPEGLVETIGDKLDAIERRAEGDLANFKRFIEARGVPTGGWRGALGRDVATPDTSTATSHGDSGKAGPSGKAIIAGAAAAAVAGAVAVAATSEMKGNEVDGAPEDSEIGITAVDVAAVPPTDDAIALETTRPDPPCREP
jgi:hypothetical protein